MQSSVQSATDAREPKYHWGQRVRAGADLYNDGSHPEHEPEALLVPAGAGGEIVQTGVHMESNTPVYMVEFDGVPHVVGCLEEEIAPEGASGTDLKTGRASVASRASVSYRATRLDPIGE